MVKHLAWFLAAIAVVSVMASAQPVSSPTEYRPQPFDVEHYELDMTVPNPYSKKVVGHVAITLCLDGRRGRLPPSRSMPEAS